MSTAPALSLEEAPTYVVIGGTGGIGSALARRLVSDGASVVVGARDGERVHALVRELGARGASMDATRLEDVQRLLALAAEGTGRLDGVANCAGSSLLKPAHATSDADWESTIAANLTTAFNTVRAGAKALPDGGSIVLVASAAARLGFATTRRSRPPRPA